MSRCCGSVHLRTAGWGLNDVGVLDYLDDVDNLDDVDDVDDINGVDDVYGVDDIDDMNDIDDKDYLHDLHGVDGIDDVDDADDAPPARRNPPLSWTRGHHRRQPPPTPTHRQPSRRRCPRLVAWTQPARAGDEGSGRSGGVDRAQRRNRGVRQGRRVVVDSVGPGGDARGGHSARRHKLRRGNKVRQLLL